jgi:carboxyl-terminal processing protease
MRNSASGSYSGIGIEVSTREGLIRVVAAVEGSPAERAGVRGGDVIVAIDDRAVDPARLGDAVDRMRGKPGEPLKLTVRRDDAAAPLVFELVRRKVQVHSVKAQLLEPGYAAIRISQFSETTADDFAAAVAQLQAAAPLRGLVIDLRNNPGGVLEAATEIADDFLNDGVIVSADGRAADAKFVLRAHPGDMLLGAPLVVLVNSGSASASEILAGALQDHHRARLLGQVTYGKGLVQTLAPLQQGGALKLTTSRYRTPSGAFIHERGIRPDVTLAAADATVTVATPLNGIDAELRAALADLTSHVASEAITMP